MKNQKKYQAEYYQKNKEKVDKRNRNWLEKNRADRNKWHKEYQRHKFRDDAEYRERRRESCRRYYRKKRAILLVNARIRGKSVKAKARDKIRDLVSKGKIIKPTKCDLCNIHCNPHGHHADYSKPLSVVWVCRLCHGKLHWK